MRGILFILLGTFLPRFECQDSDYFFVARLDTEEAICIRPRRVSYLIPTFDLDKLRIPRDVGFTYWDWLVDWQLQNDTDVRINGITKMLIAGNQPFHYVAREYADTYYIYILASNITLWLADKDEPRGAGMLFELDHLNERTKLKETTFKYCDQHPEDEGANCTILDNKKGTNFLNDGNHWSMNKIHFKSYYGNTFEVKMFKRSNGEDHLILKWTWRNGIALSNSFRSSSFAIFAKSHQRNAAIVTHGEILKQNVDLTNNQEMKRKFTKRKSEKFCVVVIWNKARSNDSNELLEMKSLVSGRVQPATNTTHTEENIFKYPRYIKYFAYFQWDHLDAGEYEITLHFDKRHPWYIDLCTDNNSNIVKTWVSIPTAVTKCLLNVGEFEEFSVRPSSPLDPTLKTNWTSEEWENVCDQLGIGSNDAAEVPIKFCNLEGCNFGKCLNLQHESSLSGIWITIVIMILLIAAIAIAFTKLRLNFQRSNFFSKFF